MTKIHLGVIDLPYSAAESYTSAERKTPRSLSAGTKTTGDIAEILEAKYHVMEHFYQLHEAEIVAAMEESIAGAFESAMMGAPPRNDIHGSGTAKIEQLFRKFLSEREMDAIGYPGIPTAAALAGVSHRFKNPYKRGRPSRPSFIDTGLYEGSFKVWVDD